MAISRSDHLFVSATFVFRLLSSLLVVVVVVVGASDVYDYTGARQFGKKLAASKHRNNTQRLPNYNWKPPDKRYGPRVEESTAEKAAAAAEFAKAEDPEQRAEDPRIRKMQEISRRKGEKWASYKRNGSGRLAHDDVAGTAARAGELTNVESIATPLFPKSVESDEDTEEETGTVDDLFEGSVESSEARREIKSTTESLVVPKKLARHSPVNEDNADAAKDRRNSSPRLDSIGSDVGKKPRNDRWATGAKKPQLLREASVLETRQRHENSEETENAVGNATTVRDASERAEEGAGEREEEREDRLLGGMVDSRPGKRPLREDPRVHESAPRVHTRRSFDGFSRQSAGNSNHAVGHRPEEPTPARKEYPGKRPIPGASRDDGANDEENGERIVVTAHPSTRKSVEAERKDETERKDAVTERAGSSFHPGRWGMSVSSPPAEFLRDITARSTHRRRKKERTIDSGDGKNDRDHRTDRWGMGVSSPPKRFLEDTSTHRGHGVAAKSRSKPTGEAAGFTGDRAPLSAFPPNRRSLQADRRRPTTSDDESVREEFARNAVASSSFNPSLEQVPRVLHDFENRRMTLNAWRDYPASVDLGKNLLLETVRLLVRATSRSNIDLRPDVVELPVLCRVRIPIAMLRV